MDNMKDNCAPSMTISTIRCVARWQGHTASVCQLSTMDIDGCSFRCDCNGCCWINIDLRHALIFTPIAVSGRGCLSSKACVLSPVYGASGCGDERRGLSQKVGPKRGSSGLTSFGLRFQNDCRTQYGVEDPRWGCRNDGCDQII